MRSSFSLTLLVIEFLDEWIYGAREVAWPLIRDDLGLTYVQIGLLLSLPGIVGDALMSVLGILGDVWRRRTLVLGGGLVFVLALLTIAISQGFLLLLVAFVLFESASGAFVSLSQATLMDADPDRHDQNMARWTLAGSVGVVVGPLALGGAMLLGIGWWGLFAVFALITLPVLVTLWRLPFPARGQAEQTDLRRGIADAVRALKRGEVLRWLILLQFSDLMLDVLLGYLALYCVDVVGVTEVQAGMAVMVWTGVGIIGDFLLIPLLERVRGLTYLRISAAAELALFVVFLVVPGFGGKLALLAIMGLLNAGWYAIPKGQLYTAMPGQSGTAMALGRVFGLLGSLSPLVLGMVAARFGLAAMMWLLLLGPVALLVGVPRPMEEY